MPLPHTFTALDAAQMSFLDDNFAALGALTTIPCLISGTNTLSLQPFAEAPTVSVYDNYQGFSASATGTNTGAVTAQVSGLGALNVYKDTISGPAALVGGEIVIGNLVILTYDSSLNAGAGGFHLVVLIFQPSVGSAPVTVNNNAGTTITAAALTGSGTTQAVILRTGAPGGGFNDTTATAAQIVAAIPGCGVNTYFRFREINSTGQTQTLVAGVGVTVSGTVTTATATTHDFVGVVTAVAVPTVTIYG